MPRFLQRILSAQNPFRTSPAAAGDDIQRPRRVLVRNSTGALDEPTHWRLSLFDTGGLGDAEKEEEHTALRGGGASVADSDVHGTAAAAQPILASRQEPVVRQPVRSRRRLSKKHRRPN